MDFPINIYNNYITFLVAVSIPTLILINSHMDFKISAIDIIANQTTKDHFIHGIVNSSIPKDKVDSWIAIGNWSLYLKNNTPSFNLNMTWHNNEESSRTYKMFNFKPNSSNTEQSPQSVLSINGIIDISTSSQKLTNIPITLNIQKTKKMILYFNDNIINRHFAKQPIKGYMTSNISENNIKEIQKNITHTLFIHPPSIDITQKNITSNNIIVSNENNSYDLIDQGTSDKNTSTTDSNTIIILENAGFPGNLSFKPSITNITKGDNLLVINEDGTDHTITSISNESSSNSPLIGKYFDTGIIHPHETASIDTSKLKPGEYLFVCSLHPDMRGILNVK
jgi:plastocyanin